MQPDSATSAADCTIDHEPVPDTQRAAGSPSTGSAALGEFRGCEVGVWEMTPGTMTDTEADELFVVLSGAATVEFADGRPPLTLRPGDVVRLAAGTETIWTVTDTLRKVYLS